MEKKYIYNNQNVLFGHRQCIGFGNDEFQVKVIERDLANEIIVKNHYSKKIYSASYIHLGVFINNELMGILQFGYAMNPASQINVVKDTKIDEYLELNRMWIDDKAGKNSESRAIAYSIKYIKKNYPKIKWIQSFADERCGKFGIVYQAANFKYYGEHTSVFYELNGVWYHNILATAKKGKQGRAGDYLQSRLNEAKKHQLRQFRYLYFIKPKYKKDVVLKQKEYIKYYK